MGNTQAKLLTDGSTLPRLLAERSLTFADEPLLICDDDVLTYGQAAERSAQIGRGLIASGVGRGGHVGLLFPNGPDFVVAALAVARIGAVAVPLSTFSTAAELGALLRGADIHTLVTATGHRGRDFASVVHDAVVDLPKDHRGPLLLASTPALRAVHVGLDRLSGSASSVPTSLLDALEASVRPSDRLVIVHTSGSTSAPKGVIHQHGALLDHLTVLNELRRYRPDDVLFSNSPFFWIGGFAYSLLGTILAGATLSCSNAVDPAAMLDLLERARPTMVNGFAGTVAHLAKDPSFPQRDLSSIRRGNLWPIMPADVRPIDPELRHNMLGMTETGSVCLASDDDTDQPEHRRGSFGKPVPGFEAQIVDPDTGASCPIGQIGELWLRGPALMEGYYGRTRAETFTVDGWYRTGDLFHVDADGFYYFTGRAGEMIKTSGANVSPREVEAAIATITGLTAHVVGVDDANRGQIVAALIRLPADQQAPDEASLRAALRGVLSAYKVPRTFRFVTDAEVPMLSSGKLDLTATRALLQS